MAFKQSRFMTDAVLDQATSIGSAPSAIVANVARSGQLGTGIRVTKLDGATPAVFNPVIGVVLTVPRMWDRWPKLQEMLRALMETHAKSITGIDFSYTLETADTPVGHDSQTMKVPTRSSRSGVNPSATFIEYPGMPVYNLFRTWIFDIQHPDSNASILPANIAEEGEIPAWYMSAYSMSMLFIQPDPTGIPSRIYDATVITNMFPTEIGELGMERSIGQTKTMERSINFTGIVQHNENTRELGYRVAEMLALHKINYNFALPGMAGSVDPSLAISEEIHSLGGLSYENFGDRSAGNESVGNNGVPNTTRGDNVAGAYEQWRFLGEGGNDAYTERLTDQSNAGSWTATGAAEGNPEGRS